MSDFWTRRFTSRWKHTLRRY